MPQSAVSSAPLASRRFTDSVGAEWAVYAIIPTAILQGVIALLPHSERRRGWLLFESSDGDRRRLAPYPHNWQHVSTFELERWCMRAVRVAELPARRADDATPDTPDAASATGTVAGRSSG